VIEFVAPSGRAVNSADSFACAWATPTRAASFVSTGRGHPPGRGDRRLGGDWSRIDRHLGRTANDDSRRRRRALAALHRGTHGHDVVRRRGCGLAERRTNISSRDGLLIEAVALWVPVDPSGHPVRIKPAFYDVYGEAMQGRKVSGRVPSPEVADGASTLAWPLRRADLDVVGHVNNAAVWQAVTEVVTTPVSWVSITHHGAIASADDVSIAHVPGSLWLVVDDHVRVAAEYASSSDDAGSFDRLVAKMHPTRTRGKPKIMPEVSVSWSPTTPSTTARAVLK